MIRLMLANFLMAFAIGSAAAQAPDTCASKAIGKDSREQQTAAKFVCLTRVRATPFAPLPPPSVHGHEA